tara:strand:+ start:821 stop:2440 length:1620 start_codon:yes stop_codon:yes gene_type:complete
MPTITLNRRVFENLVGKRLSEDKLKDRISMLGTDLEEVTKDKIIVEVFPNRPDMLSEQGFARAFSSFIGTKTGLRNYPIKKSNKKLIIDKSVKQVRPFTACAIVKGLRFNDEKIREIIQIQEKLHITYGRNRKKAAIGIYPLEKIKFPIKFLALPPKRIEFQPLEMPTKLTGEEILKKHPAGKEYAHLLENEKVYPLFVDANKNVLSMPPIINSHEVGKITEKTKEVFIECSGHDLKTLEKCLNIIVTALADMDGKIYSIEVKDTKSFTTPNLTPEKMKLNLEYINKILGLNLSKQKIITLLKRMGFGFENNRVLIPAWRTDILHPIDLAEEVAIAYGYENFIPEIPNVSTVAQEDPLEILKSRIANYLVGHNLLEVSSHHITNKDQQTTLMELEAPVMEIENPLNAEYNVVRYWLTPNLLNILKDNKHNEFPQNIFEIGTVFTPKEVTRLAIAISHQKATFTEAKQLLDSLTQRLGLKYTLKQTDHPSFIPGRVARVSINKKEVAYIGEIHPKVLNNFELETPVTVLELNISEIFKLI